MQWRHRSSSCTVGVARSPSTWQANGFTELLRDAGRTVIGVDLLGHGTAPKPHDPAAYADLTTRVVEALPDGPVDAIGFSLGAITLLRLAMREPQRFGRLVLAGIGAVAVRRRTTPGPSGSSPPSRARRSRRQPGAHVRAVRRPARQRPRRAHRGDEARPRADRRPRSLAPSTCPALVVIGDHDFAGPGEPLAEACPTRRCARCATSTTSPRRSRSASSTPRSSSSTPFHRDATSIAPRSVLRAGGLVASRPRRSTDWAPTPRTPDAVRRIFAVKGRPADHPLIVHVAAAARLGDWAARSAPCRRGARPTPAGPAR